MTDLDGFIGLVSSIVISIIIVLCGIAIFSAIISTGLAPEPGDPLFEAWNVVTSDSVTALILVTPGTVAV